MTISKSILKEAQDLIALAKSLGSSWEVEYVSIKEQERIEKEKLLDTDPNHFRIVIYTS